MVIMIACGVLLVCGLLAAVRWSGLSVTTPPEWEGAARPPVAEVVRRYIWWLTVATVAGLGAGLFVAGAGGRLAMRLLAATSAKSRGQITEAGEVVGRISLGGTIGLIVFGGLFAGLVSSLLYLLIRRWLPSGRLGGLTLGVLLLLLFSTRIDPVRADNVDFILVGPPWLAVLAFSALAILHGLAVAGLAGRYSRSLPTLSRRPSTLLRYSPVLLLFVLVPVGLLTVAVGVVVVIASRLPALPDAWSARAVIGGRVLIGIAALVALPGFVMAISDVLA